MLTTASLNGRTPQAQGTSSSASMMVADPKPNGMRINVAWIPTELKVLRQWVVWKYELKGARWTKVPYQINGCAASSTNSATWASFETCWRALSRFDGLGIVCANGLAGVDLDHKIDDRGRWGSTARRIVDELNTYTEITPSGHGLRCLCFGVLPPGGRKNTRQQIEMYDAGRFFTVTGQHVAGTPITIERRDAQLAQIHTRVFGEKPSVSSPLTASMAPVDLDDQQIIAKATSARNAAKFVCLWRGDTSAFNGDASAADLALCNMLAYWTRRNAVRMDRLFRQSGLMRPKWDEVHYADGQTYGAMTIAKAISS